MEGSLEILKLCLHFTDYSPFNGGVARNYVYILQTAVPLMEGSLEIMFTFYKTTVPLMEGSLEIIFTFYRLQSL